MTLSKVLKTWGGLTGLAVAAFVFVGCETFPEEAWSQSQDVPVEREIFENPDILRIGDTIRIEFSGLTMPIQPHDEQIKEDGSITLDKLGKVTAAGKTPGALQVELNESYKKYYRTLTVVVRTGERYYTVGGEVRLPNRYHHPGGGVTVVKAIKSAGDFTDYANKKDVQVIRANGTVDKVNVQRAITNPKLDLPIHPGDIVHVKRRWL